MKTRRFMLPAAAFAGGLLLAPAIAYAATGSFSSTTTTPAVKATNSSPTGLAIDAVAKGTVLRTTSNGPAPSSALLLYGKSTGHLSNGVYAKATPTTGEHYGVWGVNNALFGSGVRGQSLNPEGGTGVLGEGTIEGVLGFGDVVGTVGAASTESAYGVYSSGDLATDSFLVDEGGNLAGVCTVAAGAVTTPCLFGRPLLSGYKPVVTLTPQGNPGGAYWVEPKADGFDIKLASGPAAPVVFAWHVVGAFDFATEGTGSQVSSRTAHVQKKLAAMR